MGGPIGGMLFDVRNNYSITIPVAASFLTLGFLLSIPISNEGKEEVNAELPRVVTTK